MARDSDLEREESRAPLLIAGVTSAAILGGLLVVLGFAAGEPQLSPTAESETIPRQAARLEMLDAAALDRARLATLGPAASPMVPPPSPEIEATSGEPNVEAGSGPTLVDPSIGSTSSTAPMSIDPGSNALEPNEPIMTPDPAATTPAIELDSDNPYTSETEGRTGASNGPTPAPRSGTDATDNPY